MVILPPQLEGIYLLNEDLKYLEKLSYGETEDSINNIEPWSNWRNIFEYVSIVEYAKMEISKLPKGRQIGSTDVVPARYHSTSMIFYSQAVLDVVKLWLADYFSLKKDIPKSFYYQKFQEAIQIKHYPFSYFYEKHGEFIYDLKNYRYEWIHRIAGGANIYADKNSGEVDANISIRVPMEPKLSNVKDNVSRIQELIAENGSWLYSIDEFSEKISSDLREFIYDCIGIIIEREKNGSPK
ncbi:hypothetical protein JMM81_06875 [Bacillus sp. V3B]|uniref:hypothetical protein n=1 Tax=Bacillus sp. V3B TaxID=2804915 RepID=UPI00210E6596|nr:hypothetical protein [Bacillus sp. V3B]MCQ6274694.1 hypothetical protein [Bacillus sp. V3B]